MNEGFGADVLNNPEKYTVFKDADQLMSVYGNQFEVGKLYRTDVYLENNQYDDNNRPESRFMITSAGLVTLMGDTIWNLDINDQVFLENVHRVTIAIKRQVEDNENPSFDKDISIHESSINVTYEPYTIETTEYVMTELDTRQKSLQKRS